MTGCFSENRHAVFSWLSCEQAYNVLLEEMLERVPDVKKGYKYNPTESERTLLHWFALQHLAGFS